MESFFLTHFILNFTGIEFAYRPNRMVLSYHKFVLDLLYNTRLLGNKQRGINSQLERKFYICL